MILSVGGLAFATHDRSRDPHGWDRSVQVEVSESDREEFSDADGGAEHDYVMLCALLASRSSEVAGLWVEDINWDTNIATVRKQIYPSSKGFVIKQTTGREERPIPILQPLVPILKRLAEGKEPSDRVLQGLRGGVLTTANVRRATAWDIVHGLNLPQLTRQGLRHTGATWMANAGIPLHVLQKILGHKSIETTEGYLHPDLRHVSKAAELANAYLAEQADAPRTAPAGPRQQPNTRRR